MMNATKRTAILAAALLAVMATTRTGGASAFILKKPAAQSATQRQQLPCTTTTTTTTTTSSTRLYETQERRNNKSWNPFRFAQQSSKFVTPPFSPPPKKETVQPGQIVWQPTSTTSKKNSFQWAPLDDVVMGGVSDSSFDNGSGLWKGVVTDENNGGFVGIRTTPNVKLDLTKCQGLEWKFQTSANMPRRLKIVLRDSPDFNGIAWSTSADIPNTNKREVRVRVPINNKSFVPTRFAQILKGSEAERQGIDKTSVTALQLVYSKFEYEGAFNSKFQNGNFELQLLEIKAY